MNNEDLRQLFELGDKRDEVKYAWLRWLIVMASGAFALMISFQEKMGTELIPRVFMKVAWVGLGAGIIFGSIALYVEVWVARELARLFALELEKDPSKRLPVVAGPPSIVKLAEPICYIALIISVLAIMVYGLHAA